MRMLPHVVAVAPGDLQPEHIVAHPSCDRAAQLQAIEGEIGVLRWPEGKTARVPLRELRRVLVELILPPPLFDQFQAALSPGERAILDRYERGAGPLMQPRVRLPVPAALRTGGPS